MAINSTPYATDTKVVQLLERGISNDTQITVYRDGSKLATLTAGTYTLVTPDGTKLVDAAAITLSVGVASFVVSGATLPTTLQLGEGYVEEWALTIGGNVYTFRRMAAVVRRRLYPTVSDADLTAVYSDLADLRPSNLTSYQTYIDDSWYQMLRRLRIEAGGYEYLIMSSEVFFDAHRHFALYLIWRDFHSSLGQSNGRYMDLAQEHYKLYNDEWKRINFVYDYDHDGKAENADERVAKQPVVFLCKSGNWRNYRRFRRY